MDKALEDLHQAAMALCTFHIMLADEPEKCFNDMHEFDKVLCHFKVLLNVLMSPRKALPYIPYVYDEASAGTLFRKLNAQDASAISTLYNSITFYPKTADTPVKKLAVIMALADDSVFDSTYKQESFITRIEKTAYERIKDYVLDSKRSMVDEIEQLEEIEQKFFQRTLTQLVDRDLQVRAYQIIGNASRTNALDATRLQSMIDFSNVIPITGLDRMRADLQAEFKKQGYTEQQRALFADLF